MCFTEYINSFDLKIGMNIIVTYEGELFPGKVTKFAADGVRVSCMQKSTTFGSTWEWPNKIDETIYQLCDVKFINVCLNKVPGTCQKVEYHVAELENVWG